MGDEFDKAAERERLREKFEAEEADRASAQHMGELLLRGARMTDRHCPECGTPLFAEDGATFCPECEREVVAPDEVQSADTTDPDRGDAATPEDASPSRTAVTTETGAPDDVRAALEAALERAARGAASADDPRLARDHLEAATAAIEALQALEAHSGS